MARYVKTNDPDFVACISDFGDGTGTLTVKHRRATADPCAGQDRVCNVAANIPLRAWKVGPRHTWNHGGGFVAVPLNRSAR
jgi:hypothetical protein